MWIHVDLVTAVTTVYWVIDPRVYFFTMSIPLQSANTSLIISVINSSKANRHCHVKSLVVNFVRVYLQGKSIHRAQSRGYRYFDNRWFYLNINISRVGPKFNKDNVHLTQNVAGRSSCSGKDSATNRHRITALLWNEPHARWRVDGCKKPPTAVVDFRMDLCIMPICGASTARSQMCAQTPSPSTVLHVYSDKHDKVDIHHRSLSPR